MMSSDRYDISPLPEAQFEPGSRGHVLRNKLGIKSKREMDRAERSALKHATEKLLDIYDGDHRFTSEDVRVIHNTWLGDIYSWGGEYRKVKMSKGDFSFAFPEQIPKLMDELERGPLREFTPCRAGSRHDIANALAVVHAELVLIHPFREGNGRVARLLSTLMALQAGLPPPDFGVIACRRNEDYITAIQSGIERDYNPMREIFESVIRKTLRTVERR